MGVNMIFGLGLNSRKWTKFCRKTERETKKQAGESYHTWKNIIKAFNTAFEEFSEKHEKEIPELKNSMIYFDMVSFTKRLTLIQNLTYWGYYHSSLQELRFLLETTILAFYLDQQLPKTDYSEKILLMQKHKGELWGERLRRRAYMENREFGKDVEKVISDINESIDEYLLDNKVDAWKEDSLPYIEREFDDCVRLTKNAIAIIMRHYTQCYTDFEYHGEMIITHLEEEVVVEEVIEEQAEEKEQKEPSQE